MLLGHALLKGAHLLQGLDWILLLLLVTQLAMIHIAITKLRLAAREAMVRGGFGVSDAAILAYSRLAGPFPFRPDLVFNLWHVDSDLLVHEVQSVLQDPIYLKVDLLRARLRRLVKLDVSMSHGIVAVASVQVWSVVIAGSLRS